MCDGHAKINVMDNGLLLLGGAAALWLIAKAETGKNLQFIPLGASWDGGALRIQIGVQNPTSNSLQYNSLAAQVSANGTVVGNLSGFVPKLIAPNQQTTVDVNFTPNLLGSVAAIFNQVTQGGGITIAINGSANVNSIVLPVNLTFQAIAA